MIRNYIQFLRNNFGEKIYFNYTRLPVPDKYALVRRTYGKDLPAMEMEWLQVMVYAVDSNIAEVFAEEIYYATINADGRGHRAQLMLPEANDKGIIYPAKLISSVMAESKPHYFGLDENNRTMFIFNLIFRI